MYLVARNISGRKLKKGELVNSGEVEVYEIDDMETKQTIREQREIQVLERIVLRHPKKAMELLSRRGVVKFMELYREVTGLAIYPNLRAIPDEEEYYEKKKEACTKAHEQVSRESEGGSADPCDMERQK